MRISTAQTYNLATSSMADANQSINKTQEQLSTGKKVLSAADDPVAATRIQLLNSNLAQIEQYKKNITIAENNLKVEESALKSINNLLQRIEELAVQAGNTATLSASEYAAIASEVDTRLDELFNLVNTRNVNGDYIFAGYKTAEPAFSGDGTNGFTFDGDEGHMNIKVDDNTLIPASTSGKALFVDVKSNNNTVTTSANPNNRSTPPLSISIGSVVDQVAYDAFYPEDIIITFNEDNEVTPSAKNFTVTERSTGKIIEANHLYTPGEELVYKGVSVRILGNPASADTGAGLAGDQLFIDSSNTQDVLTTLMQFRDVLRRYDGSETSTANVKSIVASTISNISNAQASLSETVTAIGAKNNTLLSIKDLHADTELVSKKILSDLSDADYASLSTQLSFQTLVLQAAQASFIRISELNLFNRL